MTAVEQYTHQYHIVSRRQRVGAACARSYNEPKKEKKEKRTTMGLTAADIYELWRVQEPGCCWLLAWIPHEHERLCYVLRLHHDRPSTWTKAKGRNPDDQEEEKHPKLEKSKRCACHKGGIVALLLCSWWSVECKTVIFPRRPFFIFSLYFSSDACHATPSPSIVNRRLLSSRERERDSAMKNHSPFLNIIQQRDNRRVCLCLKHDKRIKSFYVLSFPLI